MNNEIRIIDTTLRDGEQAPGVCFSAEMKVKILSMLYDAGIRDFEIGTPAIGDDEQDAIRKMLALNLNANLSVWCRANQTDLQLASDLGVTNVNLSLPVSSIQLSAIGKDENWALEQLSHCLEFASQNFEFITVGAQDASRSDVGFLFKYINLALSFPKVGRIRIADTVGIMNPFSVHELFRDLCNYFSSVEFEFHGHNDLGMANANALAAIKGGALLVSVTVNGLGERCGNTPLEEFVLALEYSEGIQTSIHKRKLQSICTLVSELSGRSIHESKPFNGKMCFVHESGIHTRSLLVEELAYQPFLPHDIGAEKQFIFGKHSGGAAVRSILHKHNIHVTLPELNLLLSDIKANRHNSSSIMTETDILSLYFKRIESGSIIDLMNVDFIYKG